MASGVEKKFRVFQAWVQENIKGGKQVFVQKGGNYSTLREAMRMARENEGIIQDDENPANVSSGTIIK